MYLDKVIQRLEERGHPTDQFKGCSETEIMALEAQIEHKLPLAYREFLHVMGHDTGGFVSGTECVYEDLAKIQRLSKLLLKTNGVIALLPRDAFFFVSNGYHVLFFRLSEGDDPPVYSYLEGDQITATFPMTFERYSDFLVSMTNE